MAWLASSCTNWPLWVPLLLESLLVCLLLWRTLYHVYWRSHPRRIVLHIVLGLSCMGRLLFWLGRCHVHLVSVGIAGLWWANSFVLLGTASVIFQWSSAVRAGRVANPERQKTTPLRLLHPLAWLHLLHLIWTSVLAIQVLSHGPNHRMDPFPRAAASLLLPSRILNVVTLLIDVVGVCYVALQLKTRLQTAALVDEMKKKSVVQITLLMLVLSVSLLLELGMDVPHFVGPNAWADALSVEAFCFVKYGMPGLSLTVAFLYIMRRIEQPTPRLVTLGPSHSLVEFVACASPDCVWCAHHRRYLSHTKRRDDVTRLTTGFSPRTVDSSFHSSIHANLSQGSWSSDDGQSLEQLQQAYVSFHQARGDQQESYSSHGDYHLLQEETHTRRPCFMSDMV